MGTVWQPVVTSGVSVGGVCAIERNLEGPFSELSKKPIHPFVLQFLTFSERLSNVNIDIIHRIDRTGSYAEVRTAIVVIFWVFLSMEGAAVAVSSPRTGPAKTYGCRVGAVLAACV